MRVFGGETEYGLTARTRLADGRWRRMACDDAAQTLFASVASEHATTNVFLPNGGRLYLDVGSHPEYATAEAADLLTLLTHERAGDDLVAGLAARAVAEAEGDLDVRLFKNNADTHGNTYGSHENYQVSRDLDYALLTEAMVPFLVTRQIICGAGALRSGRFVLGQRSAFLRDLVSPDTTKSRPLINTRDEPLADPGRWRRLHVIAGDSNLGEATIALKWGATLAVLEACEAALREGQVPFAELALADPSAVVLAASENPLAVLTRRDGTTISALDVQRGFLAAVSDDGTPERAWVLRTWTRVLDAVADDRADDVADLVDWAAKRALLRRFRERHGVAPNDPKLAAIDLACHELGERDGRPAGLLRLMEARGERVRLTNPKDVQRAQQEPPPGTRAHVRGALVAAIRAHGRDAVVDWQSVTVRDFATGEVTVALPDPLVVADAAAEALIRRISQEPRVPAVRRFQLPNR
ncbi:MAG TPA: Pup--protein ligase [Propionibacteriaceae bacterium]|nr:proteasome accessory factor PafA2 family protein [Micropruina sp.]HBX82013.1 Pup--protein ligase [Propionibacteriaceae bacterium]HBY24184.1 Pup--protein ligase [Propionibacteriaceae bacterium]